MQPFEHAPRGFTGTISLRLTELIQMVCLSRSDLVIRVSSKSGIGTINIRQGQICHAQTDQAVGEEAFFEVLGWSDGQFEVLSSAGPVSDSIKKPWEHLLLEAMRRLDESKPGGPEKKSTALEIPEEFDIGELLDSIDSTLAGNGTAASPEIWDKISAKTPCGATRVLIVDDSPFFAKKLMEMLVADPEIEVVGIAPNGEEMLKVLESGTAVNVITLDIEMPVMHGETTIKHIMIRHRRPVLIVSSVQPKSAEKIFDFLQLGAVDFISKPGAREDHAAYAARLRELVKGASEAHVSNFRRLRKPLELTRSVNRKISPSGKFLVVVGAEGAHIDWFRLPIQRFCQQGTVIGLQKLSEDFVSAFARLIENKTGVGVEPLLSTHTTSPGNFYLGNASRRADLRLRSDKSVLDININTSEALDWKSGIQSWLGSLAELARDSMTVFFLSGIDGLADSTVYKLLASNVRVILPPTQSLICTRMVDSICSYSDLFPKQVVISTPDALAECL